MSGFQKKKNLKKIIALAILILNTKTKDQKCPSNKIAAVR